MVASHSFAEFLREQLAPLGRVTMRRMFCKTGVFCDRVMFGMMTDDTLYFRVDDHNRAVFKEAESFPPLSYLAFSCQRFSSVTCLCVHALRCVVDRHEAGGSSSPRNNSGKSRAPCRMRRIKGGVRSAL
jgi:hypothetical protein